MSLTIRKTKDVVTFDIEGDLLLTTVEEIGLHRRVKEMLRAGEKNFLINFAEVPFMDSTGVGEFLACFVSIQNAGGKLKLEKINQKIRLIFEITGIIMLFKDSIFDDEEAAVRSFL